MQGKTSSNLPIPPFMVGKPRRLHEVFQNFSPALFFVTINTADRRPILANDEIHHALRNYALQNVVHGRVMGRYVIMPDHVHCFIRVGQNGRLSDYVRLLKQSVSKTVKALCGPLTHYWQPGFFDHLLRHGESYSQKWLYVEQNPVRAGLVSRVEDWPYQGEIARLEWND